MTILPIVGSQQAKLDLTSKRPVIEKSSASKELDETFADHMKRAQLKITEADYRTLKALEENVKRLATQPTLVVIGYDNLGRVQYAKSPSHLIVPDSFTQQTKKDSSK